MTKTAPMKCAPKRSTDVKSLDLEQAPVECRALALAASEGTITHASMQADLQAATDKSRRGDIFEAETVAEPDDALDYINEGVWLMCRQPNMVIEQRKY
jgi:hypothetical protein